MDSPYKWNDLTSLQLGRYAEHIAMMRFLMLGLDVYSSEVDDRGIDLLLRKSAGIYWEIQVKSSRENYIFFPKSKFKIHPCSFAAIGLFFEGREPDFYLIPSVDWLTPNSLLVDRNYDGLKSAPEYGVNISKKNMPLLSQYKFDDVARRTFFE